MTSRFQLSFPEPRRRDGWFRIGNIDVTTTALLCLLNLASMLLYAISPTAVRKLAFIAPRVRDGELWRLITWPIASEPSFWVLIGIVFFWIFGHYAEDTIGKQRFAGLVALVVVVPAALVTLVPGLDVTAGSAGLSLLGTVMLVLFAAERPNAPFFFGIPAVVIATVFVSLDVLRYTAVDDLGNVLQPAIVEGQVHGGVAQGWGQVFGEHAVYDRDSGQFLTASFMDYPMPRADWLKGSFTRESHPVPTATNMMGAKGVGESGCSGSLPALMNALSRALRPYGISDLQMPVTPVVMWRLLKDAAKQAA